MLFKEKCKIVLCLHGIVFPLHRDLPEKYFCYILHSKYLYQLKKIIKISPAQYGLDNAIHTQGFYVPHIPEEIRFSFYYVFQEFFLIVLFQCLPLAGALFFYGFSPASCSRNRANAIWFLETEAL